MPKHHKSPVPRSCGVAGIAPPGRPTPFLARMIVVTLSNGQRLAYPVCHLPSALGPVDEALGYLSNPTGIAPP
jgi:hypothetical protein